MLPWKREDDYDSGHPLKQNEFPAWCANKEYLPYSSPSATFLGTLSSYFYYRSRLGALREEANEKLYSQRCDRAAEGTIGDRPVSARERRHAGSHRSSGNRVALEARRRLRIRTSVETKRVPPVHLAFHHLAWYVFLRRTTPPLTKVPVYRSSFIEVDEIFDSLRYDKAAESTIRDRSVSTRERRYVGSHRSSGNRRRVRRVHGYRDGRVFHAHEKHR